MKKYTAFKLLRVLSLILAVTALTQFSSCGVKNDIKEFNDNSELLIKLGTKEKDIENIGNFTKVDYGGLSLDAGYYLRDSENGISYKISGLMTDTSLRIITEIEVSSDKLSFLGFKVGMETEEVREKIKELENIGYVVTLRPFYEDEYYCEKGDIELTLYISGGTVLWNMRVNIKNAVDVRVMID